MIKGHDNAKPEVEPENRRKSKKKRRKKAQDKMRKPAQDKVDQEWEDGSIS